MPIYEYECPQCGVIEIWQKISEGTRRKCPEPDCRKSIKRLVSAPSLQFKGTGWYVTDYANKGKAPTSQRSSEQNESGGSGSDSGSSASGEKKKASGKGKGKGEGAAA